jgi:hypothetical protein
MHGGTGHACRQAGSRLPQLVLASLPEKKEEKDEDDYLLRKKKKKKKKKKHPTSSPPLLLLLFCFPVPSPELSFPSKHCPKKETKTAMPKKTLLLDSISLFPSHTNQNKKVPYKISLTKSCSHFRPDMYYNHGRERDRETERARTRR